MGKFVDLTGSEIGMITVLHRDVDKIGSNGKPIVMWKCRCACGNEFVSRTSSLKFKAKVGCGCRSGREQNLIGKKFGKLTVVKQYGNKPKNGVLKWECLCECGNTCVVSTKNLQRKDNPTTSCGCTRREYEDLTGKRFGMLTVIGQEPDSISEAGNRHRRWKCQCDCGGIIISQEDNLKSSAASHCGCMAYFNKSNSRTEDISGQKFGKLTAIKISKTIKDKNGKNINYWLCKCDCGKLTEVSIGHLKSGHTASCGCSFDPLRIGNLSRTHGESKTKLYHIYSGMKNRCYCKNNPAYQNYGARGIKICDEWIGENGYENFSEWARKSGYDVNKSKKEQSIDRIDVNGDYSPENCRWATSEEQSYNQRKTVKFEYNGEVVTLKNLQDISGLKRDILYNRIVNLGWSIEKAINTPHRKMNLKHANEVQ